MFNIFKKTKVEQKVVEFSIDKNGLEHLSKSLSEYTFYKYDNMSTQEFQADMCYLQGVADTLIDGKRTHEIILKLCTLVHVLEASYSVTVKECSDE